MSGFESMQLSNVVENPTGAARMAALKRYHILDTDRDAVFDGIAEIAAALLDAPIAVVNFIADDRQWFKAEIGIGQRELPLDVSICRIALPERGIFVVPDLACDGRFSRNPLVTAAEGLRFYAGTVLESEGVPIGTVCVLDTKPRPDGISDVQRRGLEALAVQAMAALERSAAAGHDRFKLALSEALLAGDDANDMMSVAARMIGEYLDVVQVGFGVVDDGGEYATVGQAWNNGRMPTFAGRWRLDDFGPDRVALLNAGRTLAIDDVHLEDRGKRTVAGAPYILAIRSALCVPLVRENALVAVLFVYHPDARAWRDDEIGLVEDCAARLWSAVMRARADERLLQSEALIRSVLDASPDCIKSAGLDGRLEFMNANGMCAMEIDDFGTIAGVEWVSLWPPEASDQIALSLKAARTGQSTRFEAYCPTAKGTPKWWDVAVAPILGVDGTPTRIVSISREITDRVQNESQLRANEALFRTLAESLPALLFLGDSNGANTYTNPQFADYTGMESDTLLGNGWFETMHPDDRAQAAQAWDLSWRQELPFQVECRFRAAGGEFRTFLVRGNPVRDDNGKIIQWVATFTDIEDAVQLREQLVTSREELIRFNANLETQVATRTSELVLANRKLKSEIKRREVAQAALIQGQKLEALGQLTAGIAHDFNNILSAIAGGMDLIERRVEDEKIKFITGHCKDAAFRGATVVKQMLAFARQEVLAPRSAKLARLADEIAPLIRQAIPGNIVSIDFPADLPPVLIDPVLLETALLNLAVNARDAMPGGGTLSLTASVSRPEDRNHPAELKAVEAVAIAVRDNGEGMPPEIVQRVTEPFFTTKAPGKGTGLGLAMVYGFIGQSGGAMHIDSRVGLGTTITLYLPLDTATGGPDLVADVVADMPAPTGVGAVLLVDDDPAVRAVAAQQLRDLGYTITEADGYAAAMTRITAGEPFDCAVSDVVMPGGDGVALAAAIRSTRPGLPILLMTGRADSKRVAGEQVLHKPFKLLDLATAVADAIDLPVRELATVARIASRCRSRCVAEMLEHWSAAKFAGKVPGFAAFDAAVCSEPHKLAVVIADASQLPMGLTVVSAGKDLEELLGRPTLANAFDVRGADGFGSAEESYRRAVHTRQPVFDYIKMDFGDGGPERFERLILPYSSGDGLVDRLVSIVVFAKTA